MTYLHSYIEDNLIRMTDCCKDISGEAASVENKGGFQSFNSADHSPELTTQK